MNRSTGWGAIKMNYSPSWGAEKPIAPQAGEQLNESLPKALTLQVKCKNSSQEIFGVIHIHTPNHFSKSAFSRSSSTICPSGRSLVKLA